MGFIKQKLRVERRAGRDSAAAEARCVNNSSKCKTQQIGDAKRCRGRHKTRVAGATLILSELQPISRVLFPVGKPALHPFKKLSKAG